MHNESMIIFWIVLLGCYFVLKVSRGRKRNVVNFGSSNISLPNIRVYIPGWEIVDRTESSTVWRDEDGDVISLTSQQGNLGFPSFSDAHEIRKYCRRIAESMNSGLIEAALMKGPSIIFIYKRLDMPAFVFTGTLVEFYADNSLVWTVITKERGITGIREAVITDQLFNEGKLTIEDYETRWARDPYDPCYCGVKKNTLRYISDDETYDVVFPDHPLSKVRRELKRILTIHSDSHQWIEC